MMLHILVDADACPVVRQVEEIASRHVLPVMLLCDEHHIIRSDYSQVRYVSAGADAVDIALMNLCRRGDIVITQDYGLASMCLARNARILHQDGWEYTHDNIQALLFQRHTSRKIRAAGGRTKGPSKRTPAQDTAFSRALSNLLQQTVQG